MPSPSTLSPDDHAAIAAIMARQVATWNAHDMAAYAEDLAPDVVWINVVGMHWRGREQVRDAHAALHRTMFAASRLQQLSLELRPIAADAVIGVSRSAIEGAGQTPDGRPYPGSANIMTLLFTRDGDGWRIAHAHNTTIDARAAAHDPSKAPAGAA